MERKVTEERINLQFYAKLGKTCTEFMSYQK